MIDHTLNELRAAMARECADSPEHSETWRALGAAFDHARVELHALATARHHRKKVAAAKRFEQAILAYREAVLAVERVWPPQIGNALKLFAAALYADMERAGLSLEALSSVPEA